MEITVEWRQLLRHPPYEHVTKQTPEDMRRRRQISMIQILTGLNASINLPVLSESKINGWNGAANSVSRTQMTVSQIDGNERTFCRVSDDDSVN